MSLRKITLILLISLFLMGLSESSGEDKALISTDAIMPTLLNYLLRQSITMKVPHYMEKDFAVVFDELPDLKSEEKRLINNLKLKEVRLSDINIEVKLEDLSPVGVGEKEGEQGGHYFLLNDKNDLRCKIKSFRIEADLKVTRRGGDIFGNKLSPIRATIEKFELKDIDSLFNFYLGKSGGEYYAEKLALKHMVLSPKASIRIREFPPIVNKIISNVIGPLIANVGNKEVLNDAFYREFNANLPPRIPESSYPNPPGLLQDILN